MSAFNKRDIYPTEPEVVVTITGDVAEAMPRQSAPPRSLPQEPLFILPVERPPSIEAQTTGDVRLRFWLEKTDLAGPLTLEIRSQKLEVKNSTPLDLEKLDNARPRVWTSAEWKL